MLIKLIFPILFATNGVWEFIKYQNHMFIMDFISKKQKSAVPIFQG